MSAAGIVGARMVADALRARFSEGEAGRVWFDMPLSVRVLLLEVVADGPMTHEAAARQPWAALPPSLQIQLGALARQLHRSLAGAECLR